VAAVRLDVSVARDGQLVAGLTAAEFEVKDDGVVQDAELVTGAERALQAVLVLDTSSSVAGQRLETLKRAASAFVAGLAKDDAASVIAFSHRIHVLPADRYAREPLRAAIEALTSGGATALDDAVFAGLLRSTAGRGSPMLLVFSDGRNTLSWLEQKRVLEAARELETVVHGIAAGESGSLRELADVTGGTVLQADGKDLEAAFRRILETVQNRYVLRYTPRGVKGAGWHRLQVRLRRGKAELRVRGGYRR
jgi:tight adherence protein B